MIKKLPNLYERYSILVNVIGEKLNADDPIAAEDLFLLEEMMNRAFKLFTISGEDRIHKMVYHAISDPRVKEIWNNRKQAQITEKQEQAKAAQSVINALAKKYRVESVFRDDVPSENMNAELAGIATSLLTNTSGSQVALPPHAASLNETTKQFSAPTDFIVTKKRDNGMLFSIKAENNFYTLSWYYAGDYALDKAIGRLHTSDIVVTMRAKKATLPDMLYVPSCGAPIVKLEAQVSIAADDLETFIEALKIAKICAKKAESFMGYYIS